MKKYILILLIICATLVIAQEPPTLTDFQVFHGVVNDLPNQTFVLKAVVNGNIHSSTIGVDGGYEVFKVYASNGDLINFTVMNQLGVATQVGTTSYTNQAITAFNLQYPVAIPDTEEDEPQEETPDPSLAPTTCAMNWLCGGWSACTTQETRTCQRVDNCAQWGTATQVVNVPKPTESRSCSAPAQTTTTAAQACSPNLKRCLGATVQQCAADGTVWNTVQSCPAGCNSVTFSCTEAIKTQKAETQSPATPGWVLPLIGSLVLLIVIGLILFFIHKKKAVATNYGPGYQQ